MIDIEILTAILKVLGYSNDSEQRKKQEHVKDQPTEKNEDEEYDIQEG